MQKLLVLLEIGYSSNMWNNDIYPIGDNIPTTYKVTHTELQKLYNILGIRDNSIFNGDLGAHLTYYLYLDVECCVRIIQW